MKKSILSLSAAVALSGLGFAGSANALVYVQDSFGQPNAAQSLVLHPAGTGHQLITPYYTANEGLATLINIVNTDSTNGKAVKVRFRGASNSDDVLDFTLFLSPDDVWSGQVQMGADGVAEIVSGDNSCTLPAKEGSTFKLRFNEQRLPGFVEQDVKAALTREGYVEVLNMADVLPDSPLYNAIKHDTNGVAPCSTIAYSTLLSVPTTTDDLATHASQGAAQGLSYPTGGLFGSWAVWNLGELGIYSGAQTAVLATTNPSDTVSVNGFANRGAANINFFPQRMLAVNSAFRTPGYTGMWTADPVLVMPTAANPHIAPLWFDFPDMSTPLLQGIGAYGFVSPTSNPGIQADRLTDTLAKRVIMNEYIATPGASGVPFTTDWVVSQPTRRYHATLVYGTTEATTNLVDGPSPAPYDDILIQQSTDFGPQACVNLDFRSVDREEQGVRESTGTGDASPGTAPTRLAYCGEVFVAQFGETSTLKAVVTNRPVTPVGGAGWATLTVPDFTLSSEDGYLPMLGYQATRMTASRGAWGSTFEHRWAGGNIR